MIDDEERIRQEAHKLWEQEGRPEGRSERHWAEAREIVALRDSNQTTLKPVEDTLEEPAESPLAVENLGDLPGMTDQGEEKLVPSLDAAKEVADEVPLVTDKDARRTQPAGKTAAKPADERKPAASKGKSAASPEKPKAQSKSKAAGKDVTKRKTKTGGS